MATLVQTLLSPCRPSTVPRGVVTVAVDAVDGVRGLRLWFLTHVRQEVFKSFPSLAHSDSTAAVQRVGTTAFIRASLEYPVPTSVLGCALSKSRLAMCDIPGDKHLRPKASATARRSAAKGIALDDSRSPTVTEALPQQRLIAIRPGPFENAPVSEAFAGEVYHGR